MIKLQYHFLPLKLGVRSDKARSTKSTPPIHLLYALMAWGCDTLKLPLSRFHRFTFPTGSTLTALLPIVTTLLSFHQISSIWSPDVKNWYSPLSIFLNSLTYFNGQPFVLSARKVTVALKPFPERVFMSWFDEKKNMVSWRISTRGKWRCNNAITQGFVTVTTVSFTLINCYTIWTTSITC